MCLNCQRIWKENHAEAMKAANLHMDAEGVPEDSLVRGIAEVQLACNGNPLLKKVMRQCWSNLDSLLQ